METKQTAVQWLFKNARLNMSVYDWLLCIEHAEKMEREQSVAFHKWMKQNDIAANAERFFHYTDEDMFNEFMSESTQSQVKINFLIIFNYKI